MKPPLGWVRVSPGCVAGASLCGAGAGAGMGGATVFTAGSSAVARLPAAAGRLGASGSLIRRWLGVSGAWAWLSSRRVRSSSKWGVCMWGLGSIRTRIPLCASIWDTAARFSLRRKVPTSTGTWTTT